MSGSWAQHASGLEQFSWAQEGLRVVLSPGYATYYAYYARPASRLRRVRNT